MLEENMRSHRVILLSLRNELTTLTIAEREVPTEFRSTLKLRPIIHPQFTNLYGKYYSKYLYMTNLYRVYHDKANIR